MNTRILTIWLVFVLAVGAASSAETPSIEGHWEGAIEIPANSLEIQVDFALEDGVWTGKISIPAQGASGVPLQDVAFSRNDVSFKIPGAPGDPTFAGKLADDGETISGDFTQAGQTIPFKLTRGKNLAAKAAQSLEGFDAFIEKGLEDWQAVGLAMGVVADDRVVYAKGFGKRNRQEDLPVTPDTLFAIGSSSKAFTAFAMGLLVDEGRLDWDMPVREYLPEWRLHDEFVGNRVTPRDMVNHRTGLPRHDLVWYNNRDLRREGILHRLQFLPLSKGLREVWQYNNLMFVMAGYLVGQLRGTTWEQAIQESILDPLGMINTNFSVADSQQSDDYALPYQVHEEEIEGMNFRDISNVGPAGSINSSVNDMVQWMRVFLNKGKVGGEQIIQLDTLTELVTPQMVIPGLPASGRSSPASYGMGWMLSTYQGKYRVQHGGNIDGFSALVTMYPFEGLGIVVLTNQNASALPSLLTAHATDRILDLEGKDWMAEALENRAKGLEMQKESEEKKETLRITGTQHSHPLQDYAGDYVHPGYGKLSIAYDGDALTLTYNGIVTPLEHWHYDTFNGLENPDDRTFEDFKLQFETNLRGDITSVSAPFEPSVDPIVFRREAEARLSDPDYLARFTGRFELGPQKMTIAVKGDKLTLSITGQPTYTLKPYKGTEFNIGDLQGFSVEFQFDEEGGERATQLVFKQPNGVFTAKRIED
ncbi:MAG TPA: serine hydrolase [Acidobacteriota bacterium]|nr:serine hydrolase [Acidobacteriota bacterium]